MAKTEEYGRIAADCLSAAQSEQDEIKKASLLAMARVWQTLADQQGRSDAIAMGGKPKKGQPDPTDIHVGTAVRKRRVTLRLTQEEIGEALGVTFQQVQKYEKGTNRISASKLHKLAEVMKVPVAFFYEGLHQVDTHSTPDLAAELGTHADALELIGAFQRIESRKLRRSIVALVDALGADEGDERE